MGRLQQTADASYGLFVSYMVMTCDLPQVENPAPVVAIAETTTDKWTDD